MGRSQDKILRSADSGHKRPRKIQSWRVSRRGLPARAGAGARDRRSRRNAAIVSATFGQPEGPKKFWPHSVYLGYNCAHPSGQTESRIISEPDGKHGDACLEREQPVLRNLQLRLRVPLRPWPADRTTEN